MRALAFQIPAVAYHLVGVLLATLALSKFIATFEGFSVSLGPDTRPIAAAAFACESLIALLIWNVRPARRRAVAWIAACFAAAVLFASYTDFVSFAPVKQCGCLGAMIDTTPRSRLIVASILATLCGLSLLPTGVMKGPE